MTHTDLKTAYHLYNKKIYGNSAYHLQQALEKAVKAYLYREQVFTLRPDEVGHQPLIPLMKKLIMETNSRIARLQRMEFRTMLATLPMMLYELKNLLDELRRDRIDVWKESLDLPTDDLYQAKLLRAKDTLVRMGHSLYDRVIPFYFEQVIPKLDSIPVKEKYPAIDELETFGLNRKLVEQFVFNRIAPIDSIQGLDFLMAYVKSYGSIAKRYEKPNALSEDLKMTALAMYPFRFAPTIIRLFPHETIGRYPIDIGRISTLDLYKQNKKKLAFLAKEVRYACKMLLEFSAKDTNY